MERDDTGALRHFGRLLSLLWQERRVLALYASGLAMKSVARELGIAEETARTHLKRVREKYSERGIEARTKVDLFRQATRDGWMSED